MSASTGASLVSGCIISDIGNAAKLSRDYLGELQPPYQNLLQVTTQADTLTYIKVFSECMPVSTAPGSDDSRQLLSSLRCRAVERPAPSVHTVHQCSPGSSRSKKIFVVLLQPFAVTQTNNKRQAAPAYSFSSHRAACIG